MPFGSKGSKGLKKKKKGRDSRDSPSMSLPPPSGESVRRGLNETTQTEPLRVDKGLEALATFSVFLASSVPLLEVFQRGHGDASTQWDQDSLCQMAGPIAPDDPWLLRHARERYLEPPSTEPYDLEILSGKNSSMGYNVYRISAISWLYLDTTIRFLFKDEPPGFFVEAGALDGEYISNSLQLELEKGWKGLLVEVDEEMYARLRKKNRKAWTSSACLATKPYPHQATLVKFINHEALTKDVDSLTMRGYNALTDAKDLKERMGHGFPTYQTSQCLPLQTLLLSINATNVTMISLDVEEMERDVLNSFYDSKVLVTVDVWIVEHRHPEVELLQPDRPDFDFIYWFLSKGYSLYTMGLHTPIDYIFIRNGSGIHERAFAARPPEYEINLDDYLPKRVA
ncbi:uncharacterized protein [Macrobrachium rosenbergii]|uniref:uncharacterized protein n=1 Tax=Macrobrachium rosenbergii TaxID=79674 RepID=UPI0034D42296